MRKIQTYTWGMRAHLMSRDAEETLHVHEVARIIGLISDDIGCAIDGDPLLSERVAIERRKVLREYSA